MTLRLAVVMVLCTFASAQTAVDMAQDSHHSLLLQNNLVRVFKASLKANEQVQIVHHHNFLVVALDDCDIATWREDGSNRDSYRVKRGDVRFYFQGRPVVSRTNQTTPCRSVIVEFLNPKVTIFGPQWGDRTHWEQGRNDIPSPVDPHGKFENSLDLGKADAMDVQLLPGDAFEPPPWGNYELLIPVTAVDLQRSNQTRITMLAGEAGWTTAAQKTDLINAGSSPARFVIVEFW